MKKQALVALFLSTTYTLQPISAHSESGRTAAQILDRDIGTRALALGGAFTAIWGDAESAGYNPAGLAGLARNQGNFMYSQGFGGDGFGYAGIAAPIIKRLIIGVGASQYDAGKIELNLSNGTKETRNAQRDIAGFATAALQPLPFISLGGTLKPFSSTLAGQYKAAGTALDVGGIMKFLLGPSNRWGVYLGGSILNAGPGVAYISVEDPLPTKTALGASLQFPSREYIFASFDKSRWQVGLSADVHQYTREPAASAQGFELTHYNFFAGDYTWSSLRLGRNNRNNDDTWHAGFGWGQNAWGVNFASVQLARGAGYHNQLSLAFNF